MLIREELPAANNLTAKEIDSAAKNAADRILNALDATTVASLARSLMVHNYRLLFSLIHEGATPATVNSLDFIGRVLTDANVRLETTLTTTITC